MNTALRDPGRVLIVDDEVNLRAVLRGLLERDGFKVVEAKDGREALARLEQERVAVVLTDLRMPEMDGLTLLQEVKARRPELPVVLLTAHGNVENAVEAMRAGAFDFVTKPFESADLLRILERAVGVSFARQHEVQASSAAMDALIGDSAAMQALRRQIQKMAATPSSVLILGETGTGKELVARALHELSDRAAGPFVATNCAAIPDTLVEAELFGHEKGAFSGAVAARPGRFELADGGTLFLDEIGDMALAVQPKILRALEQRELQRVGAKETRQVDVRFLAATHPDLPGKVERGEFRRDLFYRVGVLTLEVPPLRERRVDIPGLVEHFRRRHMERLRREVAPPDAALLETLQTASYPGNVRELENVVERLVVLSENGRMRREDLPPGIHPSKTADASASVAAIAEAAPAATFKETVRGAVEALETEMILRVLKENGGNVTRTAEALGLSRKGLQLKMKDYGLSRRDSLD